MMTPSLDQGARRILEGKNFATVATLNPDGGPQTSTVLYVRDGDTLVFSTTTARQKARNLARDPRISVSIFDIDNPYDFVELRGTAELAEDAGRVVQRAVSQKYLDEDPPPEPDDVVRLAVRVIPEKVNRFSV